jgi:MFS family permease
MLLLAVLSANMLLDALEVATTIVAMPAISADLAVPLGDVQWAMTAFAIGFGGTLLLAGRIVEAHGRRRLFLVALGVFAVMSLVSALAEDMATLAAARLVKGVCVALTAPTGLAIITATYPEGPPRARALSIYSLAGASGFTVGLLLSGVLTEWSWRWALALPVPAALALLVLAARGIPVDRGVSGRGYGFGAAAALLAGALFAVFALAGVAGHGWTDPVPVTTGLAALLAFATFVLLERRSSRPLLRLTVLRRPGFLRSALGAAALNGSFWGLLVISTFHLQARAGWSPLETGLAFLPASVLLGLAVPVSAPLVARFGSARPIAAGAVFPPIGYFLYGPVGPNPDYWTDVFATMLLAGLGFALGFAALHVQAVAGIAADERGMASGAYQTSVQIGGAVAVAAVVALGAGADARPALAFVTALGVCGLVTALMGVRRTSAV